MKAEHTPESTDSLTDAEIRQILLRSELWDMHVHIGWYSAPEKAFKENGIKFARDLIARLDEMRSTAALAKATGESHE